jgi:basic amino acid/polyamine antiporter, APA family
MGSETSKLRLGGATAVVLANVIGSGIFVSLHFQAKSLPDAWSILSVWVVGAFLAWCGAVCYAELASVFPDSGGEAEYLGKIYHPLAGFLSGWVSLIAGFPAPMAAVALLFGAYTAGVLQLEQEWLPRVFGAVLIALVALGHCVSLQFADKFHRLFTYAKVALLLGLTLLIFFTTKEPQHIAFQARSAAWSQITPSAYFVTVLFVLYTYTGWNAACYMSGEVHEPTKLVPRALLLGLGIAAALYILFNFTLLRAIPAEQLQAQQDVLTTAAGICLGEIGARITLAVIAVCLISSVSGLLWVGSRVTHKVAGQNLLLRPLQYSNRRSMPVAAVLFQAAVAIAALCLFPNPENLLLYVQYLLQASACFTVAGLFFVRLKQKKGLLPPSGYRAVGYPVVPVLFLIASVLSMAALRHEYQTVVVKGLLTLGLGIFIWIGGKPQKSR